jgi:hypothetical protein
MSPGLGWVGSALGNSEISRPEHSEEACVQQQLSLWLELNIDSNEPKVYE